MTIAYDDSHFPLIVVTFPRTATDDEFRAYLARMDETAKRGLRERAKVAVLLDATLAEPSPATQRKLQADWLQRNHALLASNCAGLAFVIHSPLVRGVMTAIFWFQAPPAPYVVCGSRHDAMVWCESRLPPTNASSSP